MASVTVEIVGLKQLAARLNAMHSPEVRKLIIAKWAVATTAEAKHVVPKRKGVLSASILPRRITTTSGQVVAKAKYAAWVEFGTGIYGPTGNRIYPKQAKLLRWPIRTAAGGIQRGKSGGFVYARSIAGQKPQPFLIPSAKKVLVTADLMSPMIAAWNAAGGIP